jgi:hypothetical protein
MSMSVHRKHYVLFEGRISFVGVRAGENGRGRGAGVEDAHLALWRPSHERRAR